MFAAFPEAQAERRPAPWNAAGPCSKALMDLPLEAPLDAATPVVSAFYDRFPYPGDPLQDGPPP